MTDDLLSSLLDAEDENPGKRECPACKAIRVTEDPETQRVLERALSGTIGGNKLARILSANGIKVSTRQIRNHRAEKRPTV